MSFPILLSNVLTDYWQEFMAQLNRQKNKPAPLRIKHAPGLFTKSERKSDYGMFDV